MRAVIPSRLALAVALSVLPSARGRAAPPKPAPPAAGAAEEMSDPFQPSDPGEAKAVAALDAQIKDAKYPLFQDPELSAVLRKAQLAWYRNCTVEAFDRVGTTKAPWAAVARKALEARAAENAVEALTGQLPSQGTARSNQAAREALAAGCDDPLVRYFSLRLTDHPQLAAAGSPLALRREVTAALYASGYPDVRKVHAAHNLIAEIRNAKAGGADPKELETWLKRFWELYERVAKADDPYAQRDVITIAGLKEVYRLKLGRSRLLNYQEVEGHLKKCGAPEYTRLMVKANFLVHYAWDARGDGTAGTVTEKGWEDFRDRLAEAAEAYEAAWKIDPKRSDAPTGMLTICTGGSRDREEMERWFDRAIRANPDNRSACARKLNYLHPKWHGSVEDLMAFGWQCVRTRNAYAELPLVVVESFAENAPIFGPTFKKQVDRTRQIYSNDNVWVIVATPLRLLLHDLPEDQYLRGLYARLACIAGRYDVANGEFERLGDTFSPAAYESKADYDLFRKWAKEKERPDPKAFGVPAKPID